MRILMLVPHPHIQGPLPKLTPLLVEALRGAACEVTTACWGRHHDNEGWGERFIGRARDMAAIRRLLLESRFDLLLVTTSHDWKTVLRDVPLLLSTSRRRPLTILQFHGSRPDTVLDGSRPLFRFLSRFLVRMADGVLVLSSEERLQWKAACPSGKFFVVTNPFRADAREPPKRDRGPGAGPPVVLFVGRLIPQKGIFELVEAVARLLPTTPLRLVLVGAGNAEDELRRRIRALGLEDHTTLTGYLEGERLQAAYHEADLFVLPSWREGFPTVVAEAMAAGLPIVTTHLPGTREHLEDGVHAVFVPARDSVALADGLRRLLLDSDLRTTLGRANREKVRDFAPAAVARHYLTVFQSVRSTSGEACAASAVG